ncbi:MAG TPA: branched-chain amino acid ABC transporter permease/ATP-binding protein [Acidimicrobiales bacterium]|nr:branched-chain amino acid ABC transporter permease/ATP-binding protein [Acidimicrobiales bacterium]
MDEHVAFLLRGAGSGGVYAALAMALVVTYRSSGVVNFATGAIALYVAETYARLRMGTLFVPIPGLPAEVELGRELGFLEATAISLIVAVLLGLLLHYLVFRPLRTATAVAKAVASIGVMIVVQAVISIRLGFDPIVTGAILPGDDLEVMGQQIRTDRLWFAAAVVGLALVLGALFRFTRFGLATRAVAETEKGAVVTGLSPERISRANWALSVVVAGLAGILISPIVPIVPVSYTLFIVPALAAALVGGFAYVGPAVAAGLLIGMLQSELVYLQLEVSWLPDAGTPELVPLLVIVFVLVVRGRPLPERGAVITRTLGRAPRPERVLLSTVVGTAVGVAALLLFTGGYRYAVIVTFIFGLIALSWVVVTGYAGQVSFAQLSLAGVGAFSLHRFAETLDLPFPLAPLLAALAAAVIGVVVGLPALRIRGLPVAVVTLALATALEGIWFRNPEYNGGLAGANIGAPHLFGIEMGVGAQGSRIAFGLLALTVLVAVAVGVALLRRHRLGASMLAVKANERSAAAVGIDVARTKLLAFAIGAFIAGLAGSLLGYLQTAAVPQTYSAFLGVGLFSTVFLSGITSIAGGINAGIIGAGGIFFTVLDRNFEMGVWYTAIAGALLIITVIANPDGVIGTLQQRIAERRTTRAIPPTTRPARDATSVGLAARTPGRATQDGPPILSVRDLTVRYGPVTAVDYVSFDIARGHIVGLIGPNGAGKTTLIDAISGFADCRGSVELDGERVDGIAAHQRARRGMARTFQSIELYDDLTVEENMAVGQVAAGRRERGTWSSEGDDVDRLCGLLRLDEVRARPVKELSAGYRQLVSVGRALAGRPKVLLLDEPAGGLDTDESRWLGERLHDVRDAGITVVMIDHDMSLVLGVCDQIHVLDLGALIASGSPSEIGQDPRVAAAYLGTTSVVGSPA